MINRMFHGTVVLAIAALAVTLAGCPSKKPAPGAGLGEGGLGGQGRGSLDQYARGGNPQEGGPLADVHFDYDRYDIQSQDRGTLQQNAEWLKANPNVKVEIEGHCDNRGTVEYNLALGAKRAKAVKDYLLTLGIAANRLSTISYGEELPLCHEENESCWARNRRAHSVVLQ